MGIDINGWIEVRILDEWRGAVDLTVAGGRDYWVFDCLFGTHRVSSVRFAPLAERRGIPPDPSPEILSDLAGHDRSCVENITWLSWAEIVNIDWSHTIEWPTVEIEIYSKRVSGPVFRCIKSYASLLSRDDDKELMRLGSIERRGHIYKVRKDVASFEVSDHWKRLFGLCSDIAEVYGPSEVRFVVWFE